MSVIYKGRRIRHLWPGRLKSGKRTEKSSARLKCLATAVLIFAAAWHTESYAAIKGSGSMEDPYQGDETAESGDSFLSGMYIKNFTYTDGSIIKLKADYEARSLIVYLSCEGGTFGDGTGEKIVDAEYGESLTEIFGGDTPSYEGKLFSGWYIKGNRRLASEDDGIKTAGDIGDCIHTSGSTAGYILIDPDDAEDKAAADIDERNRITARALWRAAMVPDPEDGFEAQDDTAAEKSADLDIWDAANASNKAIEYIDGCSTTEEYAALHGKTKYQYGRAVFCAETTGAESYSWYIKRETDSDYEPLADDKATLKLGNLKRRDNHAKIRCIVKPDENTELIYETELTVFSLPDIEELSFSADGKEVKVTDA